MQVGTRVRINAPGEWGNAMLGTIAGVSPYANFEWEVAIDNDKVKWLYNSNELEEI